MTLIAIILYFIAFYTTINSISFLLFSLAILSSYNILEIKLTKIILYIFILIYIVSYLINLNLDTIKLDLLVLAMFTNVLFIGNFPKKSFIRNKTQYLRKDLSIYGFLLITPHVVKNFITKIDIFGITSYLILIPLIITSTDFFRKEITYKEWKTIQKLAYPFYVVLLIHVIINAKIYDIIIYSNVLTLYITLFLQKAIKEK